MNLRDLSWKGGQTILTMSKGSIHRALYSAFPEWKAKHTGSADSMATTLTPIQY